MEPKLLLGLALVLSGSLFGCVHHHQANEQSKSSGLTLRISVYPEKMDSLRIVPAFLVLSNGGFKPMRFSKICSPIRVIGPDERYDITWLPGHVTSGGGAGTVEQFRQESEVLYPGQSAELPFTLVAPTNRTLRITAHYNTETSFPDAEALCHGAGLWIGQLDAEPVVVRFQEQLTWPAVAPGHWEWTPNIVSERFNHASKRALGSEEDITEINKTIATHDLRQKLQVTELRWLSPTLAMARVSGENIRFDYVVEKKAGQWLVLVHYTRAIMD